MKMSVSDANREAALTAKNDGNQYFVNRNFKEALEQYDKAIELDPNDMTYYCNRAAVHFERKDFDKCVEQCKKAEGIGRQNRVDQKALKQVAKILLCVAEEQHKNREYKKSMDNYSDSIRIDYISGITYEIKRIQEFLRYIKSGTECADEGNYPNAIKHFTEAIKRNPEDAEVFLKRTDSYQKSDKSLLALKDCEQNIQLDPGSVKGYIMKGKALLALNHLPIARLAFDRALKIDGHNAEAKEWLKKCKQTSSSTPDEVRKGAMADPEGH